MNIKFKLLSFLIIFTASKSISQTNTQTTQTNKFVYNNVKTPGVSDFIKYGNYLQKIATTQIYFF